MSVAAPAKAISPAPADLLEGRDLSDPKVREEIYHYLNGRTAAIAKTDGDRAGVFSSCCGAYIFNGGERTYPFSQRSYNHLGEPRTMLLKNDGTKQSLELAYHAHYSQEFLDWYFNNPNFGAGRYYNDYDPRRYQGRPHVYEEIKRSLLDSVVVTDRVNIIFSWNLSSEEAINKWFPTAKKNNGKIKSMDFDDPVDGKACLVWLED